MRQSLDLDATMATALQRMVELANVDSGCIYLNNAVHPGPAIASHFSPSSDTACVNLFAWIWPQVQKIFEEERTDVFKISINPAAFDGNGGHEADFYLTGFIPLVGKRSLPGVMVLIKKNYCGFSNHERELYQSIGAQIGISIENGILFKTLVQKEESLSQLLHKLIVAQEEERRRIARELHDETSQSLTALSVGLQDGHNGARWPSR